MFVYEFGDTAYVARNRAGEVIGYLFGFVMPHRVGYVHLVAVRDDSRGLGVARHLYEIFTVAARARGAESLKAISNPQNEATAALHRRLGFDATTVDDYGGSDADALSSTATCSRSGRRPGPPPTRPWIRPGNREFF